MYAEKAKKIYSQILYKYSIIINIDMKSPKNSNTSITFGNKIKDEYLSGIWFF